MRLKSSRLAAALLVAAPVCAQMRIASSRLAASFDPQGRLTVLEDLISRERLALEGGDQFFFLTDSGEISERNCRRVSLRRTSAGPEVGYSHPEFDVRVTYKLQPQDHFLQKSVGIQHRGRSQFAIRRFCLHSWAADPAATALVPFQHGASHTYFLRKPRGGFFFGLGTPFSDPVVPGARAIELSYAVNMIFPPGASYEAEPAYWGVYSRTGRLAPPVPPRIDECTLSATPPDAGESEAMVRMIERLAPPSRPGITVTYNGYSGGLSYAGYSGPDASEEVEQDKAVLSLVRAMLGPFYVSAANLWFGAQEEARRLSREDERLPPPPARQRLLDWMRASEIRPLAWISFKSVNGWARPPLGPYAADLPDWQANPRENCPANPVFMQWLSRILFQDIRTGFQGYLADEPGPTMPRFRLHCPRSGHAHLPGDVSYPYFFQRRAFFRHLRTLFGPSFELQGMRPHQDAGIWDILYQDTVFTLSESGTSRPQRLRQADRLREWARIRRSYTFVPSYMDQIMIQPGLDDTDYLMLSVLAVSSNYLFVAPATPETLKQYHRHVGGWRKEDRQALAGYLLDFPQAERGRIRYWLDWAREHTQYMRQVIDLPDWPGSGKPDGYLRIHNNRGFAFLFNPTSADLQIELPLTKESGLDAKSSYRIRQIHPAQTIEAQTAKGSLRLVLKPRAAYLWQIDPR